MKMPVKWHLECLHNQIISNEKDIKELQRLTARIEKSQASIDYYQLQIDRAILEHKTEFDSEKYKGIANEAKK